MANKSNQNKKNVIIGVCVAVLVLIAIIVAIILGSRNGGFGGLNDSYFKSDGSKYVLTVDSSDMIGEEEHTYAGDKITGLKAYYEYTNNDDAKAAYEYYNTNMADEYKSITRDGKYVILEIDESGYEGVTPDDVKQQIEYMEMLNELEADEVTPEDTTVVEETDTPEDTTVVEETEVVEEVQE